jgi:hypothetical protein
LQLLCAKAFAVAHDCCVVCVCLLLQPNTPDEAPAGAAVAGLLQLAMNSSSNTAAQAAAYHIPAQLEPAVARKLLTTAALRQHVSAVQHMAGLAVVQQHIDATALQSCLQELLAPSSLQDAHSAWRNYLWASTVASQYKEERIQRSICVHAACAMPAAALLGTDAVTQLLLASMQARAHMKVISRLCGLPAARQLSSDQAVQILDLAIKMEWTSCTAMLCSWLPPAQQLDANVLVQLMRTALCYHSKSCVALLCHLPRAQQISSDMLMQLLMAALEHDSGCIRVLLALPAAAGISRQHAKELLLLAYEQHVPIHQPWPYCAARHLAELPAVQQFGTNEVLQLMLAATTHRLSYGFTQLCKLPAAQQLSSSSLCRTSCTASQSCRGCQQPVISAASRWCRFWHQQHSKTATGTCKSYARFRQLKALTRGSPCRCWRRPYR